MTIYIITTNYFYSGVFGSYSSIKRARIAFKNFLTSYKDIVSFEDIDGYAYQFTTERGETFGAEIISDLLDSEFEEGLCEGD